MKSVKIQNLNRKCSYDTSSFSTVIPPMISVGRFNVYHSFSLMPFSLNFALPFREGRQPNVTMACIRFQAFVSTQAPFYPIYDVIYSIYDTLRYIKRKIPELCSTTSNSRKYINFVINVAKSENEEHFKLKLK